MEINQLVFAGGGVRAVAYAGALEVLSEVTDLASVARVAGTSAGSLAATLVALGAQSTDITSLLMNAPYESFADGHGGLLGESERWLRHYGLHPGDALASFVRDMIGDVTQSTLGHRYEDLTLGELGAFARTRPQRCAELSVISTNVTRQSASVLSASTTPALPIWKAVRMSMSIPGFFEPVLWEDDVWVDGGVSWNYPIDLFDKTEGRTLGMCLGTRATMEEGAPRKANIHNLESYLRALVLFSVQESTRLHLSAEDIQRTVFVPDEGITTLDLKIERESLKLLVEGGREAMRAWLQSSRSRERS